jgi:uncharacterized protein (DUF1015 family)
MVRVYRFAAVRPNRSAAPAIAAVPYDVVTADEARENIAKNPRSFLRVSRSDAQVPEIPPHDARVYELARENFLAMLRDGSMQRDDEPSMYIYRVVQDKETFTGLCCCVDVDDYRANRIRRHEQTRYEKEEDRTRHIGITRTHNGPVVLLYPDKGGIYAFIESLVPANPVPDAEVRTETGVLHQIFRISDPAALERILSLFAQVPNLYIADGHHRAKSAVNVADQSPNPAGPGEEINRFLAVLFAHDRVKIHGYSRLVTDLGPCTEDTFLQSLKKFFDVQPYGEVNCRGFNIPPKLKNPDGYHIVHIYLDGTWYECTRPVDPLASVLDSLDVTVLQDYVLEGLLGISDPRGDPRLQYLGGARPIADLARLVDGGAYAVAFAMQPIRVGTVLAIADAHGVMPPKSTWFEPKLLSGLVVHTFE